jgi:hypothetical protein
MKADCEVVVDRNDLLLAVGCEGPARSPLGPDELMIWPASRGLYLMTASLSTQLSAMGRWSQSVLLDRTVVEKLITRRQEATVRLLLVGTRVSIDRTLIDAWAVGTQACPFRSLTAMPAERPAYQLPLFRSLMPARKREVADVCTLPLFR